MKNLVPNRGIFKNHKIQQEMFALRIKGWTYVALAKKYKLDRTTILYHCQKYDIDSKIPRVKNPTRMYQGGYIPKVLSEGRPNQGKDYKDYLKDEKDKKFKRLLKR